MAQLVAHLHGMQGVRGSSPLRSTGSPDRNVSPKLSPDGTDGLPASARFFGARLGAHRLESRQVAGTVGGTRAPLCHGLFTADSSRSGRFLTLAVRLGSAIRAVRAAVPAGSGPAASCDSAPSRSTPDRPAGRARLQLLPLRREASHPRGTALRARRPRRCGHGSGTLIPTSGPFPRRVLVLDASESRDGLRCGRSAPTTVPDRLGSASSRAAASGSLLNAPDRRSNGRPYDLAGCSASDPRPRRRTPREREAPGEKVRGEGPGRCC